MGVDLCSTSRSTLSVLLLLLLRRKLLILESSESLSLFRPERLKIAFTLILFRNLRSGVN